MRSVIVLAGVIASFGAQARSITLDPTKGETLEAWSAHPDMTVTEIHLQPGQHGRPTFRRFNNLTIVGVSGAIVGRTWLFGSRDIVFRGVTFRGLMDPEAGWKNRQAASG